MNANGNNTILAAVTRRAPTSSGANTNKPFFIRMKEVPQMIDKMISRKIAVKRELSDMVEEESYIRIERLKITNGSAFSNPILAILKVLPNTSLCYDYYYLLSPLIIVQNPNT
jgi:hypothetical protein